MKMRHWRPALTIVAVLVATLFVYPEPAHAAALGYVTLDPTKETAVNVRADRSTTAAILGVLRTGGRLSCYHSTCDIRQGTPYACTSASGLLWVQVNYFGRVGWMARQCVVVHNVNNTSLQ